MTSSKKIAVLISGSGSNLKALIDQQSQYNYQIGLVISNRPHAGGLNHAKQANIPAVVIDHTLFNSREEFDNDMIRVIDEYNIQSVILAGFMRILSENFTLKYLGRMLNIHPSLLPKYPGLHTHLRALEAKDTVHGVSIHFVTPELDGGPVILQSTIKIEASDTEESLQKKIHTEEHQIYPLVTHWLASEKVVLQQDKVFIDDKPITAPIQLSNLV